MKKLALSGMLWLVAGQLSFAQAERKEIFLDAPDFAQGRFADEPTKGKWWLRRDAKELGAPRGNLLLTGKITGEKGSAGEWSVIPTDRFVAYKVSDLVIDPQATGWYRVFLGLYHDPVEPHARLLGKISGEPYPEYLQAPQDSKSKVVEVYWKAADLTGKKIHLSQPPGPMQHPGYGWFGGVSHLRLVPMTEAEVRAAKKEIELPPAPQRLFGMLDYTDEVFWWGTLETEDDIRAIVYRHRESGFGRIYWRCFGSVLDNSQAVPEANARWTDADEARWCKAQNCQVGWKPYIDITKKFDPLQVAVAYGTDNGCEVHAWVRFTNFNREPYAHFWHDNQKFLAQRLVTKKDPKTGKVEPVVPYKRTPYSRVLSLAYPEVRAFYLKFFKQLAGTGTRGILIDLLRHPPIAGYEPIVADAFRAKYGMDMEMHDLWRDPLVQEHLSQYLRLFLVDLRKEVGKDMEIAVRTSGPDGFALRGKEWIAAGLIDTIIDGNWYSGNGPRPTIDATVAAAGQRGHALAIAETNNVDPKKGYGRLPGVLGAEAIAALAKHYSGRGVESFGIYESTMFTWYPDLRRAIRAAGWNYDPKKK